MNRLLFIVIVVFMLFQSSQAPADPCERKCWQFNWESPLWGGDAFDGANEYSPYNAFDSAWIYIGTGDGNLVDEEANFVYRNYPDGNPCCAPTNAPGLGYVNGDPGGWITIMGSRHRCGLNLV